MLEALSRWNRMSRYSHSNVHLTYQYLIIPLQRSPFRNPGQVMTAMNAWCLPMALEELFRFLLPFNPVKQRDLVLGDGVKQVIWKSHMKKFLSSDGGGRTEPVDNKRSLIPTLHRSPRATWRNRQSSAFPDVNSLGQTLCREAAATHWPLFSLSPFLK